MRRPIEKLVMSLYLGRDLTRQVESLLAWINTVALPDDRILVDFPAYRRVFCFGFPLGVHPAEQLTAAYAVC